LFTGRTSTGATGTGKLVFATSPTFTTPTLGVATATTLNGKTFTTGTYTLTGTAGKTLTFSNTLTLAGTDSTTMTFPSTSATIARTDAGQTFTGNQVISAGTLDVSSASAGVTIGDLYVDTPNKIVYVGRQSSTGGDASIYCYQSTGIENCTIRVEEIMGAIDDRKRYG